jgi:protein-tyrosine phosphatase
MSKTRLLFVCLGNICRSPIAEGVFAHVANEAGHGDRFILDSAGTAAWHVGDPPDPYAQAAAAVMGIDLSNLRSRQVRLQDFAEFDLILAMDSQNQSELLRLAPQGSKQKVRLFLDDVSEFSTREVPDPYNGGAEGFALALDMIEVGSRALLNRLI